MICHKEGIRQAPSESPDSAAAFDRLVVDPPRDVAYHKPGFTPGDLLTFHFSTFVGNEQQCKVLNVHFHSWKDWNKWGGGGGVGDSRLKTDPVLN